MLLNQTMAVVPMPAGAAVGPTTNLNIGMDYWGAPTSGMRGKVPAATPPVAAGIVTAGSRDSSQSQLWLQVEFFDLYLFTNLFLCILFQSLCYFNLNFFLKKRKGKNGLLQIKSSISSYNMKYALCELTEINIAS